MSMRAREMNMEAPHHFRSSGKVGAEVENIEG